MDATPLTAVKSFWLCGTVKLWFEAVKIPSALIRSVALGGTAVQTNTPAGYDVTAKNTLLFTGHPVTARK
jgi:fumarate hydratase class II